MRIYPLADQRTHTQTHFHLHSHTQTLAPPTYIHARTTGIHAHRKVLIGCCPALHDAIYWLRVQYPVARDSIAYNEKRGCHCHTYIHIDTLTLVRCLCRRFGCLDKRFWPFAVWWHSASLWTRTTRCHKAKQRAQPDGLDTVSTPSSLPLLPVEQPVKQPPQRLEKRSEKWEIEEKKSVACGLCWRGHEMGREERLPLLLHAHLAWPASRVEHSTCRVWAAPTSLSLSWQEIKMNVASKLQLQLDTGQWIRGAEGMDSQT